MIEVPIWVWYTMCAMLTSNSIMLVIVSCMLRRKRNDSR